MEWLHPITLEEEIAIDVKIAGVVAIDLHTQRFHDRRLIEPLGNISKLLVAEVTRIFTFSPDVINVLASALVRANESIVAVNRSGNTGPNAPTVVATRDERLATWERVLH